MASSAEFQIDVDGGGYAASPQNVAAGSTITCRLVSVSGILPGQISWSVTGTSGATAPTLTTGGTPSGQTVSFTMPSDADGSAVGITCKVNGGTETTGRAADTYKGAVYVLNPGQRRPFFYGETTERDANYGVVADLNDALKSVGPEGTYEYVNHGETTVSSGTSNEQLDTFTHGITSGTVTVDAYCDAADSGSDSATYGYTQRWNVSGGSLGIVADINPTASESDATWDFSIYDAGSGAIGIRATADGTNDTKFKWTWRVSTMVRP